MYKSDSNGSMGKIKVGIRNWLFREFRWIQGNKSASKNVSRLAKWQEGGKSEEERNTILTALKFFKDQNQSRSSAGNRRSEKNIEKVKEKAKEGKIDENEPNEVKEGDDTESRPRTSRGKRGSAHRKRSGGGNSALGFQSKQPQNSLFNGIENIKNLHNRSVNVVPDSPRGKKRKTNKGRISVNTFAAYQQKHQAGIIINKVSHTKNTSLEAEKLSMMNKSRPKSAKSKKEIVSKTAGERSKKSSVNRHHNNSVLSKLEFPHQKGLENSFLMGDKSFDRNDKAFQKFIKQQVSKQNKSITKMRINTIKQAAKVPNNKFSLIKRPDAFHKNLYKAYEHMNYFQDLNKMHSNIDDIMKENKHIMKYDTKKNKMVGITKKGKFKRSATPGLSVPQSQLAN